MKIKNCTKCDKKLSATLKYFPSNKKTKDKLGSWCRICCKKYQEKYNQSGKGKTACKRYRQTEKGKKAQQRKAKKYRKKYPKECCTHKKLQRAVKAGKIKRPNKCSKCNKKCKPDGHHPDYKKPLKVIWLCKQCHADLKKLEKL